MAGRHRCRPRSIQIIRTGIVAAKDTKRPDIQQFHVSLLFYFALLLFYLVRDRGRPIYQPLAAVVARYGLTSPRKAN